MKKSRHMLITAGPTREPLDGVRFISNYSTGTLGYCLAEEAKRKGYKVTLISGPTHLKPPKGVNFVSVNTALEMYRKVKEGFPFCDCLIMTAAVGDFQPEKIFRRKIKKEGKENLNLRLKKTPDILYEMGKIKKNKILIGFSLETENLIRNAQEKLRKKNLDLIIAQKMDRNKSPFGENKVSPIFIYKDGSSQKIPLCSKSQLAKIILKEIDFL
ncbi:MAG: phosphopantothenoylcysteine decarboxylase [Candidatus Omnitrophota bacterium]